METERLFPGATTSLAIQFSINISLAYAHLHFFESVAVSGISFGYDSRTTTGQWLNDIFYR